MNKLSSVTADFLAINGAFLFWLYIRTAFGFYTDTGIFNTVFISIGIALYWLLTFTFLGLYKNWNRSSRIDELIDVVKTISIGVFFIFIITFDYKKDLSYPFNLSRLIIVLYWLIMILFVGGVRLFLHSFYRKLIEKGIGRRKALIIGWGKKAWELYDQLVKAPALGYDIVGFVAQNKAIQKKNHKNIPVIGHLDHLTRIIQARKADELLIALPRRSEHQLEEVIAQCNGLDVSIKIAPDLYDVIVGQVRTNQIYGFPLIEILPQLITPWEQAVKRSYDVLLSLLILIGFLPLWILITILIKLDSKGPVFYLQERVGKDGKIFNMIKFRSMIQDAEKITGPVWASGNDARVTAVGRWLRKLRLDEIPQFINVLCGNMSFVGPRPERPFFVEKLKRIYPLYVRRQRIRPGITGWAQVKGEYDQSLEDVKQKLEFDLFYLENMSLRMDLKILFHTIYVMLTGRGQ